MTGSDSASESTCRIEGLTFIGCDNGIYISGGDFDIVDLNFQNVPGFPIYASNVNNLKVSQLVVKEGAIEQAIPTPERQKSLQLGETVLHQSFWTK